VVDGKLVGPKPRKLTKAEKAERTSFYAETGHQAEAVEPSTFADRKYVGR
jgi:hypothetical protein